MLTRNPAASFLALAVALIAVPCSHAIPAFSRQYGTSCTTCHIDFPKLNDFGKAFKDAGFKFPKNDEDFIKIPPVMLGAPAQKEMFPHVIWPGTIPGNSADWPALQPVFPIHRQAAPTTITTARTLPARRPERRCRRAFRAQILSRAFSAFSWREISEAISPFGSTTISAFRARTPTAALGDGYLRFVNLGRFLKLPTDSLTLRVGQFELDLPFTQARSINISPYDIYTEANIGTSAQNVNNVSSLQDAGQGIELSGGHTTGATIIRWLSWTRTRAELGSAAQCAVANGRAIGRRWILFRFKLQGSLCSFLLPL